MLVQSHKECQFAEPEPKPRSLTTKFSVLYYAHTFYLPKSATRVQRKLCHELVIVLKLFSGRLQLYKLLKMK